MALQDTELAEKAISQLKDIDETAYYYLNSRFQFFLLSNKEQAEQDANKAFELSNGNPRFHILSHLAFCKIALRKTEEAEKILEEIDQKFGSINLDIRNGLRAKLALALNRYENAILLSNSINDKSTKNYKDIRRDALQGFLNNCVMPDNQRAKYNEELTKLNIQLRSINVIDITPEFDSYMDID